MKSILSCLIVTGLSIALFSSGYKAGEKEGHLKGHECCEKQMYSAGMSDHMRLKTGYDSVEVYYYQGKWQSNFFYPTKHYITDSVDSGIQVEVSGNGNVIEIK